MWHKKNGQLYEDGKEGIDSGLMIVCPPSAQYPDGITLTKDNASEMDGYDGWQWFEGGFIEAEISDNSIPTSVTPTTWDRIKNWTEGLFG